MKKFLLGLLLFVFHYSSAQELFNENALIENLKILSSDSLEGRKTETEGNARAKSFIKTQFEKWGLQPFGTNYELPFDFLLKAGEKINGVNLAGLLKGSSKKEKYIVISAHYDHLGAHNGNIYNGADDNASGTCALFALIEYFKNNPSRHNLLFVAFDAEESGLHGATAFVKNPPIAAENILVNINVDMVARADNKELVACGTHFYPQLKPFVEKANTSEKVKIVFGHDDPEKYKGSENWTFSSDQGPFHSAKIPFVLFSVVDHKDYHQPSDDFENVDPEIYKSAVRLIVRATQELDRGLD